MSAFAPMRVLIVDDERPARQRLQDLMSQQTHATVVGAVNSGYAAVDAIRQGGADLVLLDVQMPGMTGFDVLREVGPEAMPATIFVTAHDRYALKAFDFAALDYLLKPFADERFELALARAQRRFELGEKSDSAERMRMALSQPMSDQPPGGAQSAPHYLERIAVEGHGQVRVVMVDQIDYIEASGVYVELHAGDKVHLIRERMQSLEELLDPRRFIRIHRSAIVQLDRIDVLLRQSGGEYALKLKNGVRLAVSRTRIEQLEQWMGIRNKTHRSISPDEPGGH